MPRQRDERVLHEVLDEDGQAGAEAKVIAFGTFRLKPGPGDCGNGASMDEPLPDLQRLAAELVLGLLDDSERGTAEQLAANDPGFARLVETWRDRLSPLAELLPPTPLPASLFEKVKRRIATAGTRTIRRNEGSWRDLGRGVSVKELNRDSASGRTTLLIAFQPGGRLAGHEHRATEECVVLEGEVLANGALLMAGDCQICPPGVPHDEILSPGGALVLVTLG